MACLIRTKICLAVGARDPHGFDWSEFCARIWASGEVFLAAQRMRPTKNGEYRPNGFEYEVTTPGQAGFKDPIFPVPPALATVESGSLVLTRQPLSNGSLVKTINGSVWTAEPGTLLIESPSTINTNGEQKTQAFLNGNNIAPGLYVVRNEVTFTDGQEHFGIFDVEVE